MKQVISGFILFGLLLVGLLGARADGGKKDSLVVANAPKLGEVARVAWGTAPPAIDPIKPVQAKLAELTKEIQALRGLEKRLGGAEKSLEQLERLQKRVADLDKIEKTLGTLEPRLKTLETNLAKVDAEVSKATATASGLADKVQALEDQLKKEKEEREKAQKKLQEERNRSGGGGLLPEAFGGVPMSEGQLPFYPLAAPVGHYGEGYNILVPGMGTGFFNEHFPVLMMEFVPCWPAADTPEMPKASEDSPQLPKPNDPKSKEGEANPKQEEEEGVSPFLYPLMSRSKARPQGDGLSQQIQASAKLKRGATQPLDLRGLTAKDAERLFWQGYRLYWERKSAEAYPLLEASTQLFDRDARSWYFRSLVEAELGKSKQAALSLRQAVELHLQGLPRQELISQALERVQGDARMQLRQALEARRAAR